jgi:pantoate--beta-alanine ligase
LNKLEIRNAGLIANRLLKLKRSITKKNGIYNIGSIKTNKNIQKVKKNLIKKFNIKIEYLECRNLVNLSSNLVKKPFKLFVSYYLNNIRLIDNF